MDSITIRRPDDMHVHVRDGVYLRDYVPYTAAHFGRAIIMPNLKPPVTTIAEVMAYRDRILEAVPRGQHFEPLMTLYLTDNTDPDLIRHAQALRPRLVYGVKLYPAGATTNSDEGVTELEKVYPVLKVMEEVGMPLLVHGEVTGDQHDVFDREALFLEKHLAGILTTFPRLKVVLEHVTTKVAVDFVKLWGQSGWGHPPFQGRPLVATITAHHLLENRNAIFRGGINPHNYCLPILKREEDRQALLAAATSGSRQFFAGTDSAPHVRHTKERACGCAGCFTAPYAMALYATAFDSVGALTCLETFTSVNGAVFYGLTLNEDYVTLRRKPVTIASSIPVLQVFGRSDSPGVPESDSVVPFWAGKTIPWTVE